MKKKLPKFKSDQDLERFINRDLSSYLDNDNLSRVTFEFAPKDKVVNLRMSDALLREIKKKAKKRGIPYQRFIREAVEFSIGRSGTDD